MPNCRRSSTASSPRQWPSCLKNALPRCANLPARDPGGAPDVARTGLARAHRCSRPWAGTCAGAALANLLDGLTPRHRWTRRKSRAWLRVRRHQFRLRPNRKHRHKLKRPRIRATTRRMSRDFDSTSATQARGADRTDSRSRQLCWWRLPPPLQHQLRMRLPQRGGNKARKAIELDPTRAYPAPEQPFPIGAAVLLGGLAALNLGLLVCAIALKRRTKRPHRQCGSHLLHPVCNCGAKHHPACGEKC